MKAAPDAAISQSGWASRDSRSRASGAGRSAAARPRCRAVPARPRIACEEFEIRALAERLDARVGFVGFAAVFAARGDNQLSDVGPPPLRMPAGGEQA